MVAAAPSADPSARTPWPERDRALVAVLTGAGLRARELCTLEIADFLVEHTPLFRLGWKAPSKTYELCNGLLGRLGRSREPRRSPDRRDGSREVAAARVK